MVCLYSVSQSLHLHLKLFFHWRVLLQLVLQERHISVQAFLCIKQLCLWHGTTVGRFQFVWASSTVCGFHHFHAKKNMAACTIYEDYITPSESSFMLSETHCGVVDCLVSSLWVDKATGVDGISARLLIEACPQIVPSLTHIINLSVRGGYFPDKWKISKVSLLYKEDIKSDPNNFWPISILLVVSKIIEKVIFKQLYEYLTHNNCWT